MFINEYPVFVRKHLLKIEMLESLRDYPRDLVDIYYKNYSNGILSGCEVVISGQYLLVQPGIIIHDHRVYVMKAEEKIPYVAEDCDVFLKIKFLDEHKDIEKISYLSQIGLDIAPPNQKDEIELCRFRLQKGSRLRGEFVDFEDFSTLYDTLNRIHVPYSCEEESTLWPYLLKFYAKEAMKYRMGDSMDLVFCMSILRENNAVPKQMIISYLNTRLRSEKKEYSNEEIYKELVRILEDMKHGKNASGYTSDNRKKIMLV